MHLLEQNVLHDSAVMARRTEPLARRAVAHAVFAGVTFGLAISIVTLTRKHQLSGAHENIREVYGQGSRKVATVSSSVIVVRTSGAWWLCIHA